jgi:hypothetical protein
MTETPKTPFFFGIPLIAQGAAHDWPLVNRLLDLTFRSVLAQADRDFEVVLAAHERPQAWLDLTAGDGRFTFVPADWEPEPPTPANDDGGRKKSLLTNYVNERGGGLLMFLDADDWVDRALVETARSRMAAGVIAALIDRGYAYDLASGRAAPFPIVGGFEGAFHELCGSSTIARIVPGSDDPALRDPHAVLGWHSGWDRVATELGLALVRLDLRGVYVVGTERSHSECDGPNAMWRRDFVLTVRESGKPLCPAELRRFGLTPNLLLSSTNEGRTGPR